ncbi:MAG: hypothetical protein AAF411_22375, partial [Myxococcota bacterium]
MSSKPLWPIFVIPVSMLFGAGLVLAAGKLFTPAPAPAPVLPVPTEPEATPEPEVTPSPPAIEAINFSGTGQNRTAVRNGYLP